MRRIIVGAAIAAIAAGLVGATFVDWPRKFAELDATKALPDSEHAIARRISRYYVAGLGDGPALDGRRSADQLYDEAIAAPEVRRLSASWDDKRVHLEVAVAAGGGFGFWSPSDRTATVVGCFRIDAPVGGVGRHGYVDIHPMLCPRRDWSALFGERIDAVTGTMTTVHEWVTRRSCYTGEQDCPGG